MNGRVFAGLNGLWKVGLKGNICIDEEFNDNYAEHEAKTKALDNKCAFIETPQLTNLAR